MKQNIIAASIIALGLIVAGALEGGRYYVVRLDNHRIVRMNRWTGDVKIIDAAAQSEFDPFAAVFGTSNSN